VKQETQIIEDLIMTKKERKEYKKLLKEYNSVRDDDYDEDVEREDFYDYGEDTYDRSFLSNDWNFGCDYEDF
jgi:hypothetical protein